MKNQCPYCKKLDCIPWQAFTNCENYGNQFFNVKCNFCNKIIGITLERIVKIIGIAKTKSKESDF